MTLFSTAAMRCTRMRLILRQVKPAPSAETHVTTSARFKMLRSKMREKSRMLKPIGCVLWACKNSINASQPQTARLTAHADSQRVRGGCRREEPPLTTLMPAQEPNSRDHLLSALRTALTPEAYPKGYILDGLYSKYASCRTILYTSLKAAGLVPVVPAPLVPEPPTAAPQAASKSPARKSTRAPTPTQGAPAGAPPHKPPPSSWAGDCRVFVVSLVRGPSDAQAVPDAEPVPAAEQAKSRRSTPPGTQRRVPTGKRPGSSRQTNVAKPAVGRSRREEPPDARDRDCRTAVGEGGDAAAAASDGDGALKGVEAAENGDADGGGQVRPVEEVGLAAADADEEAWVAHETGVADWERAVLGEATSANRVFLRKAPYNAASSDDYVIQQVRGACRSCAFVR